MSDGIGLAEALRASSGTAMRRHGPSTPITSMPRWCSRIGREPERAGRVGAVAQLGVDETSFLAANRRHSTIYATGLVDLEARIVIDMVEGNGGDVAQLADQHQVLPGGAHLVHRRELPGRNDLQGAVAHDMRAGIMRHPWMVSVLDHLTAAHPGPNATRPSGGLIGLFHGAAFGLREARACPHRGDLLRDRQRHGRGRVAGLVGPARPERPRAGCRRGPLWQAAGRWR